MSKEGRAKHPVKSAILVILITTVIVIAITMVLSSIEQISKDQLYNMFSVCFTAYVLIVIIELFRAIIGVVRKRKLSKKSQTAPVHETSDKNAETQDASSILMQAQQTLDSVREMQDTVMRTHESQLSQLKDTQQALKDIQELQRSISAEQTATDMQAYSQPDIDNMEGLDFERWCADLLIQNGFQKAEVTRGSGDQGADIIAEKDGVRYAVQCKRYTSNLGNKPVQEALAGKDIYKCHVGLVMTNTYFTAGAIEAASATNVILWDRDKILSMLSTNDYPKGPSPKPDVPNEIDPRLMEAIAISLEMGQTSVSIIQRSLRIGYARAGRLVDEMGRLGIISNADGAKPRRVIVSNEEAQRIYERYYREK